MSGNTKSGIFRRIRAPLMLLLAASAVAHGQVSDANLIGAVIDPARTAVPGARLELMSDATQVRHRAQTDALGHYRFHNIPVGRYELRVEAPGFSRATVEDIQLDLSRTQTVNVALQLAAVSSSVEVVGAAVAIDTTTAHIQTSYGARSAVQLPLSGSGMLGVLNLSMLSSGVTSSGGIGYGTGPAVGGQRPTNNNFMIEGVDNNSRATTGPIVFLSNEVVEEFSIQANQFSPEFGHSSGGQFNSILRAGSNELHGSVYEYLQNRNLNAVDQAVARQGLRSNPRYDQNRFGGTVGGPVLRNRLFYFGALEFQTNGRAATSPGALYAPTAEGLRVLDSLSGISRTNLDVLRRYAPVAASRARDIDVLGHAVPVGLIDTSGPSYLNEARPVVSADYHVSDRDQLRVRWIGYRSDSTETLPGLPAFFTPLKIRNQVASASHIRTFTAALTNELRLGYTRALENRPVGDYHFPGLDAFPNMQFNDLGLALGPHPGYPQSNRSNVFQLANNVNWQRGRHAVRFGYDGRKVNSSLFFIQRQRGEYTYNKLEHYLLDITPQMAQRSVGSFPFVGNLVSHYAFISDEIRLTRGLVVTLGLRYEFVDVPVGSKQQSLNSIASVPGVLEFRAPRPSKRDFAPRVGLAWSPGASGRTSLRAGFGMVYDQVYQNLGINSLPPQFFTSVDAHVDRPGQPKFLEGGGIPPTALPAISDPVVARSLTSTWIPDQQRPYSIQWNAGVQHVFARDYTFETRYLGTRGVHLPYQVLLNRAAAVVSADRSLPTYLQRPSQAALDALSLSIEDFNPVNTLAQHGFLRTITAFEPRGNSSYHGLATQVSRRYSNGLQFSLAHTWSHLIDDSTAVVASTLLNPRRAQDFFNLSAERADSALDRRHRFVAAWVYEPQWFAKSPNAVLRHTMGGWTFSGTYIAESGAPVTVRSGVDSNVNGDAVGDRAIVNLAGDAGRSSAVSPLRNSSGRIVGYLAADPTARYIQAGVGAYANGGRNTLLMPGINNFDLALGKRVHLGERRSLQLRAEAYNAFNHAQFVPGFPSSANLRPRVSGAQNSMLITGNALFNRPDLAFESNARTMQLVARFEF